MNYREALDFLYSQLPMYQRIGAGAFKKDLTNTLRLCEHLGNPQNKIKSVHIAGTNGKGTSAHSIASILQESGLKVGLYTSPHLKDYRERIRINGQMIDEDFVVNFVSNVKDISETLRPSFFEMTVAMAFDYFEKKSVDIAVIETGLGGRLDSTNIITPLVSLITTIGLDHQEFLGDTLEKIAIEKAGIIKQGVPVVLGGISDRPKKEIKKIALEKNASLNDKSQDWSVSISERGSLDLYYRGSLRMTDLNTEHTSNYFLKNIPAVLEVVNELISLGYRISNDNIKDGLSRLSNNTGLKGRWQVLSTDPLTICDVGHNEDGIRSVMDQLNSLQYERLHIVFGTVNDKSINNILNLLDKNATYYFCQASIPRALPVNELYDKAHAIGLKGKKFQTVKSAINSARSAAKEDDIIFIGGSTFVVAEIEEL